MLTKVFSIGWIASTWSAILLSTMIFFGIITQVYAATSITFKWDANTESNLDHYVLYWGTSAGGPYPQRSADIPKDITTYQVTGLPDNTRHYFVLTAVDNQGIESQNSEEISAIKNDIPDNDGRDAEWEITTGKLKGVKFVFDSSGDVPSVGPTDAIPAIPNVNGVGSPLNLQPSGIPFNPPVKIFIPCPGYSDVSGLNVYYYEDVKMEWLLANDADDPGVVQPGAQGWMVPNSRVEHNQGDPSTIEIQVEHFSGTQAGTLSSASVSRGGGGCFILTARDG